MFGIINKEELTKDTTKLVIEAPQIAKKTRPGQFVVVIINEKGERIPLTLTEWDKNKGLVTLIVQKVGFSTKELAALTAGENLLNILGPLGHPTEIKNLGTVLCMGGGVGIAEVYPVTRAFKAAGNRVLGILGVRAKELLILEKEMKEICDELFITTDDGSYGQRGLVTDVLRELLGVIEKSTHTQYPNLVYCVGPIQMMKAISELTRAYKIKTVVSLNPIMVDATGMCGSCRLTVDGQTLFGCVDGPDFDGHKVDFEQLSKRLKLFADLERKADK